MPKGYRKIKYFTSQEAETYCDKLNGDARREAMAGVYYDTQKHGPGEYVVNEFVCRQLSMTYVKNGILPHDYDEHYLEGHIWNG